MLFRTTLCVAGSREGWPDVHGFPMDSRGIRGERRREADAEATNTKNTVKTQYTQRIDKGCFAHTGDQTGPTQPHGEFRRGETLSPEGGLELQGEALINLVHGHTNKGLVQLGGAISQEARTTQRELTQ